MVEVVVLSFIKAAHAIKSWVPRPLPLQGLFMPAVKCHKGKGKGNEVLPHRKLQLTFILHSAHQPIHIEKIVKQWHHRHSIGRLRCRRKSDALTIALAHLGCPSRVQLT